MGMPFRKGVASQILLVVADPLLLIIIISRELGYQDVYVTFLSLTALSRPVRRSAGRVCSDACHFPTPGTFHTTFTHSYNVYSLICLLSVLELFLLLVVETEKPASL